jgi:hypothetical protein
LEGEESNIFNLRRSKTNVGCTVVEMEQIPIYIHICIAIRFRNSTVSVLGYVVNKAPGFIWFVVIDHLRLAPLSHLHI